MDSVAAERRANAGWKTTTALKKDEYMFQTEGKTNNSTTTRPVLAEKQVSIRTPPAPERSRQAAPSKRGKRHSIADSNKRRLFQALAGISGYTDGLSMYLNVGFALSAWTREERKAFSATALKSAKDLRELAGKLWARSRKK